MASLDEISLSIGSLQSDVAHLMRAVSRNTDVTEETRTHLGQLQTAVAAVAKDVEDMKPSVQKIEKWEQRAVGLSAVVSAIVTLVGAGFFGGFKR